MFSVKIRIVYLCALFALAACGQKDRSSDTQNSASESAQTVNGVCGAQVVSDYRDLSLSCRRMYSREEALGCRALSEQFLRKYPTVSCEAVGHDDVTGVSRTHRIEAREIRMVLERIKRMGV
jgi:hypothetical protein